MPRPITSTGLRKADPTPTSTSRLTPTSAPPLNSSTVSASCGLRSRATSCSPGLALLISPAGDEDAFSRRSLPNPKVDKVIQLIEYAKCLYKTQPEWLKEAFP